MQNNLHTLPGFGNVDTMMKKSTKQALAIYLLNVVFSIYLGITIVITLTQMVSEYWREQDYVRAVLATTQTIFSESLSDSAWTFNSPQLMANLDGILKMSAIVGVKIDNMAKPPDWQQPFPIRLGSVADDKPDLQPISYRFQLKKDNTLLGDVTVYSSHAVVFESLKYNFLYIIIAATVKTIVLWLLFIWAFNRFLGKKLALFCQTMDAVDIDNPETGFLKLNTDDIAELCRIEQTYNNLFKRLIEKKRALDELNASLEQIVTLRTEELAQLNVTLTQLSITDGLTGLANRRHFDDVLLAECHRATRTEQALALMMIDVDLFKKYNDHYGHQAGDTCLITVAKTFKDHAHRASDVAARYGGEEFTFIAPLSNQLGALALATEICTALENQRIPHELSPFGVVTVSIGVAVFVAGDTPDSLLKKADYALYKAKEQGRNQAVFSDV